MARLQLRPERRGTCSAWGACALLCAIGFGALLGLELRARVLEQARAQAVERCALVAAAERSCCVAEVRRTFPAP